MSEQHKVYLAVPGVHFCWGTTTGIINASAKHIVRPFNSGVGFSGAEDFNLCLIDAINMYEAGEVTHFAMLHGDIVPDPSERWLDVLLDELDEHRALIVSAHVPIKDFAGVCSCGIGDPNDPWQPYRRFTQREILSDLPATFNSEMAGYPDKPLLINTGCWVTPLNHPAWHETKEDGSLLTLFEFPEQAVRDESGKWKHQRESEDWWISRKMWQRGYGSQLWITSKVKLEHRGGMTWPNQQPFGKYEDGDEQTAHKWRQDQTHLPLSLVQVMCFELGSPCNLWKQHPECPSGRDDRYGTLDVDDNLDDDTIVMNAVKAYRKLGFTGLIGWHYYNEPLLQQMRMFVLMQRIRSAVPSARFILWTNGMHIPEDCGHYAQFEQIVVSGYNEESRRGLERLVAKRVGCHFIEDAKLDERLVRIQPPDKSAHCLRPFVEFIIDNHGNTHLCCYDWQGAGTCGNIFDEELEVIAERWRMGLPEIAGEKMTDQAPAVCQGCGYRWDKFQQHDAAIVERARRWRILHRAKLPEEAPT